MVLLATRGAHRKACAGPWTPLDSLTILAVRSFRDSVGGGYCTAPGSLANPLMDRPAAAPMTILARKATRCGVLELVPDG